MLQKESDLFKAGPGWGEQGNILLYIALLFFIFRNINFTYLNKPIKGFFLKSSPLNIIRTGNCIIKMLLIRPFYDEIRGLNTH